MSEQREGRRRRPRPARAASSASESAPDEASAGPASASEPDEGSALTSDSERDDRGRASLQDLLRDLRSEAPERRRRAAKGLGALGSKARQAAPHLGRALQEDDDEQVRYRAARALGKLGEDAAAALPALVAALAEGSKDRSRDSKTIAGAAASAIKRVGPAAAAPLVEALAQRPLRRRAARLLRSVSLEASPALHEAWATLLARPKVGASKAAVAALAGRGPEAAPLLVAALGAAREEAASAAADALVAQGRAAVKPLARALREEGPGVRAGAATTLGRIAREFSQRAVAKAAPALIKAATADDDPDVRGAAIEALSALQDEGQAVLPGLVRALGDDDSRNSLKAVLGILDLDLDRAALVERMAEVVRTTRRVYTRVGACMVLMHLGQQAKPAAPALVEALEDSHAEVREYAHLALQSIRTPSMRLQVIRTASLRLKVVDEEEEPASGEASKGKEKAKGPKRRRRSLPPRTRRRR